MSNSSASIRVSGGDPLLREILERGPRRFAIMFTAICIAGVLPLLAGWFGGNLLNPVLRLDAAHDLGYFNQFLLLLPFTVVFMRYYLRGLEPALRTLQRREVVMMSAGDFNRFAQRANKVFANPVITWLPYLVAFAVAVYAYFTYISAGTNTWYASSAGSLSNVVACLIILVVFLLYLILGALVIRIGVIYQVIRLFLSEAKEVIINPLHPDKCGGLSPLGDFSLRITVAGILAGICVVLGVIANIYQHGNRLWSASNYIIVGGYIFGLSVAFFLPLLAARKGMLEAKRHSLQRIGDCCNKELRKAIKALDTSDDQGIKNMEHIEHLQRLYEVANRMPIYPFNTENLVRFASSVVWPLMLMVITWVAEHFL